MGGQVAGTGGTAAPLELGPALRQVQVHVLHERRIRGQRDVELDVLGQGALTALGGRYQAVGGVALGDQRVRVREAVRLLVLRAHREAQGARRQVRQLAGGVRRV